MLTERSQRVKIEIASQQRNKIRVDFYHNYSSYIGNPPVYTVEADARRLLRLRASGALDFGLFVQLPFDNSGASAAAGVDPFLSVADVFNDNAAYYAQHLTAHLSTAIIDGVDSVA